MSKKLYISLIFSNLVVIKTLSSNHRMYNLYTKFVKILEICKQFSENLVNESGNVPRRGPVPKFSDLEVVALSLTAEAESIDSEKWLFDYKLQEYKDNIPNLISRRQFNDRRKKTSGLCEELRKRIAMEMDGGEEQFFVDSKPIEVCRVARGKRCKMGRTGNFSQAPDFGFCASQNTFYFPKNKAYLEDLLQREGLLLTQAKVLADFAKDETQALSLSKDKKVLDVIDIVERFEQSLLANHDLLYLDVAKLAVQCSEKSEQEMVWAFLTYQLGKEIQNPQARRWLDLVFKAREMWLANVSFQNAMEYLVLS